jgi:RNA polymerase sigma-70 factor (ECF subfamily)
VGQDVFVAVARNIGSFRLDRKGDTFRGWLYTITRNKLRDRAATLGAIATGGSDARDRLLAVPEKERANVDSDLQANENCSIYVRALEMVRSEFLVQTWDAFWKVAVDGRIPSDVAADMGVSVNVVYLAKSRVLRRLREEFATLIDGM